MTDTALCTSRKQKQLRNIPLVRFTPISPYSNPISGVSTGITQDQLNMRRKAEILKYESNRMPNQTNNFTKKQKWARIVSQPVRGSVRPNTEDCPNDISFPRLTTDSDVPGRPMYLYEDTNVPLYNYLNDRTYAFDVPNPNSYWETTISTNVGLLNNVSAPLFQLNILPNINKPEYTFSIGIPIGIHVEGVAKEGATLSPVRIGITTAILSIFCNGQKIAQKTNTLNDVYMEFLATPSGTSVSSRTFSGTRVIGSLGFSSIQLLTSPIYVFEFSVALVFSKTNQYGVPINGEVLSQYFDSFQYYAYGNITNTIDFRTTNCTINYPSEILNTYLSPPVLLG